MLTTPVGTSAKEILELGGVDAIRIYLSKRPSSAVRIQREIYQMSVSDDYQAWLRESWSG